MVNLLPTKDLHRVANEHRRRVAIIGLLFLAVALVLSISFTAPSALIVWSAASGFDDQLVATKTLVDLQRKQGGGDVVADIQSRVDLLEDTLTVRTPTSILEDLVPRIPKSVSVKQISYTHKGGEIEVLVLGTAETRTALIAFGDNLRQSPLFSQVDVPVSSLAKSEDIDFSLMLSLDAPVPLESFTATPSVPAVSEVGTTTPSE